jgi:uncharacterized protein Usg
MAITDDGRFGSDKGCKAATYSVTVAHSRLTKPAELRAIDGIFRLH